MIATLSGLVAEKLDNLVVLDVGGVGYGLLVTHEDYGRLAAGDPAKLYIYEHIRENANDLYGFSKLDTKRLFEQLLDVNGVGPKMALNILGVGSADDVRQAIAGADTKFIQAASGVGKRVAERVVIELKDKVGLAAADTDHLLVGAASANQDEAVLALMALGYDQTSAMERLRAIDSGLGLEERVRLALKAEQS